MAPEMAAVERTGGYDLKVRNFESFNVSGKLLTYPSLKPTLKLTSHLEKNVGLGEGRWTVSQKRNDPKMYLDCPMPCL